MGLRGPAKRPTNLKILNGNPGGKKLPTNEPKPKTVAPRRPKWLTGEGRKMWERLSDKLEALGLLTEVDGEAFAAACQSWKIYLFCIEKIETEGPVHTYTNRTGHENLIESPYFSVGRKALDQFKAFCREFGLTPASRAALSIEKPKAEDNLMADFMAMINSVPEEYQKIVR